MSKAQRQHRISLLEEHAVTSQAQLTELLEADGIGATQATVSRDLDELGAIKVRVPGGETVYAIPEHPVDRIAPEDHLRRVMSDWVADVNHSLNLVVLRTPPGCARRRVRPRPCRDGRHPRYRRRRRHLDRGGCRIARRRRTRRAAAVARRTHLTLHQPERNI